jgi:hypothetical protein
MVSSSSGCYLSLANLCKVSLTASAYATNKIRCCILLTIHVAAKRGGDANPWELLPKVDKGGGQCVKNKPQFWYYFWEEVKNYKIQTPWNYSKS